MESLNIALDVKPSHKSGRENPLEADLDLAPTRGTTLFSHSQQRPALFHRPLLMVLKGRRFKEAQFPGLLMSMSLFLLNELELMWDSPHRPPTPLPPTLFEEKAGESSQKLQDFMARGA